MQKPRTTISWEPKNLQMLQKFAQASGETQTEIVNSLVAAALPEMMHVIDLAEQLKHAKDDVKKNFNDTVEASSNIVLPRVKSAYRAYQEMMANLDEAVEITHGEGKEPPYSNTGVIKS